MREPTGYALKTSQGRRPFIYSDEYNHWKRSVGTAGQHRAAHDWERKFRPERDPRRQDV